jgi:transposase
MADWVGKANGLLMPLIGALRDHVFAADRLHGDDSVLQKHTEGRIYMI